MRHRPIALILTLITLLPVVACSSDPDDEIGSTEPPVDSAQIRIAQIHESLPTSLHASAHGMQDWYEQSDGFGAMIGIDYAELGCGGCHVSPEGEESCAACHTDVEAAAAGTEEIDTEATCLPCHGRQNSEMAMGLPDVHREAGMDCGDCHTVQEIHGDGTADATMFDHGVMEVRCTTCHVEGGEAGAIATTQAHVRHTDDVACQSCHMSAGVSCYNCHFAYEVDEHRKVAYGKFKDWVFLGNYRGQVYPMNFQSVEYEDKTFNAWGPFNGHTVVREGRDCNDCHGNANIAEYQREGELKIVEWDETQEKLVPRRGVIPLVPDFRSAFLFDYATKAADGAWFFLETGPDQSQIRFGTPLTEAQMLILGTGM